MTAIATSQGLPPPEAMLLGAGCGVISFCPSLESPRACRDAPASVAVSSLFESGLGWAWLENRGSANYGCPLLDGIWLAELLLLFWLRPRRHELAVTKHGSDLARRRPMHRRSPVAEGAALCSSTDQEVVVPKSGAVRPGEGSRVAGAREACGCLHVLPRASIRVFRQPVAGLSITLTPAQIFNCATAPLPILPISR